MPDLPAGSGAVIPTTLPDFTGVLGGALKGGLGVAATVMRNVESAGVKAGAKIATKSGYHATHPEAAEAILQGGFRQGTKPGRLSSGGHT